MCGCNKQTSTNQSIEATTENILRLRNEYVKRIEAGEHLLSVVVEFFDNVLRQEKCKGCDETNK